MRLIGIDQQERARRRQVPRPPARNRRGASLHHRYGILVVRVAAKDVRSGKTRLKKIDSGHERGTPKSSRLRALVRT